MSRSKLNIPFLEFLLQESKNLSINTIRLSMRIDVVLAKEKRLNSERQSYRRTDDITKSSSIN